MRREFLGTTTHHGGTFSLTLVTTSVEAHQDFLAVSPEHMDLYLEVCGQLLQQLPAGDVAWDAALASQAGERRRR
jgi:hypothetical protein